MVADVLGDQMAPIYIMRLWAHCQDRKSDRFVMPTRGLKAQCKYPGDAEVFEATLIDAGFIERQGDLLIACGWAEKNAALIAAWENGQRGGRPRKERENNQTKTHGLPSSNPAVTQREPTDNQELTHAKPIREEKIREDKKERKTPRAAALVSTSVEAEVLIAAGFDEATAKEFIAVKLSRKAPLTPRAWADHCREAQKAGWTPMQAAEKVMAKTWKGFEARFVERENPPGRPISPQTHPPNNRGIEEAADFLRTQDERNKRAVPMPEELKAKLKGIGAISHEL